MKTGTKNLIILIIVIAVVGSIFAVNHQLRLKNGTKVSTQCEVVDKHRHGGYYRNPEVDHVVLRFVEEQYVFEKEVEINLESFDNTKIGTLVSCDVTYDEDGIIKLKVTDDSLDLYTPEEKLRHWGVCICITVGIILLPVAAFLLPEGKLRKSARSMEDET